MNAPGAALSSLFTLERNPFGKLVLTTSAGERFVGVVPVRAFPIQSPHEGLALVTPQGHEVAWIDRLDELPEPYQCLIRGELADREFVPVIQSIQSVSSYSTPCTWTVLTDRGPTAFTLRAEEDIRRIGMGGALLVSDAHSIQVLIRAHAALDAHSRKILDRFL